MCVCVCVCVCVFCDSVCVCSVTVWIEAGGVHMKEEMIISVFDKCSSEGGFTSRSPGRD